MPTRIFGFAFGVRCAHTDFDLEVVLPLKYLPMCAALIYQQQAVLLGEDYLSTWLRSRSYEFRSPDEVDFEFK